MEPLEFSFTATGEDHARAIRAFTLRQPLHLALIGGAGLLTVTTLCLFLGIIMLSLMGDRLATNPASFACIVPLFIVYLFIPARLLILGPYLAGQQFKKHQDKVGQGCSIHGRFLRSVFPQQPFFWIEPVVFVFPSTRISSD